MESRHGRITSLINKISRQRGREGEATTIIALAEMARDSEIISFYKTAHREDKFLGIDTFIIELSGEKAPLQIKSSLIGALNHSRKFPNIPVVVIRREDSIENAKIKIRGALKLK